MYHVFSSLLGPDILNSLFSQAFYLCLSLGERDQVSHPYRTRGETERWPLDADEQ